MNTITKRNISVKFLKRISIVSIDIIFSLIFQAKQHFCVLFSINKLTLKLYVNIITIINFVYLVVNK
jgi:hypothetical protein